VKKSTACEVIPCAPNQLRLLDGAVILVCNIEGIRADVLHDNGEHEGFYKKWLENNSTVIKTVD
jgi:hypothetical protein